ncbi:MAG: hypothetical protein WCJ70_00480 [bacterium]
MTNELLSGGTEPESVNLRELLPRYAFIGPETLSKKQGEAPFPNVLICGAPGVGKGHIAKQLGSLGIPVEGFSKMMKSAGEASNFPSEKSLPEKILETQEWLIAQQKGAPLVWEGHLVIYPDEAPTLVTAHLAKLMPTAIIYMICDPNDIFEGQKWRYEEEARRLQYSSIDEVADRQAEQFLALQIITSKTGIPIYLVKNSRGIPIGETTDQIFGILQTHLPDICKKP